MKFSSAHFKQNKRNSHRYLWLLTFCFTLCLSPLSLADTYSLKPDKSTLNFHSSVEGIGFSGEFAQYSGEIHLDQENSSIEMRFDLGSVNTEQEERDEILLSEDFFNLKLQRQAVFTSTEVTKNTSQWLILGLLSINKQNHPIKIKAKAREGLESSIQLEGEFSLKRLKFKVGIGDYADFDLIPAEVKVNFKLHFEKQAAKP